MLLLLGSMALLILLCLLGGRALPHAPTPRGPAGPSWGICCKLLEWAYLWITLITGLLFCWTTLLIWVLHLSDTEQAEMRARWPVVSTLSCPENFTCTCTFSLLAFIGVLCSLPHNIVPSIAPLRSQAGGAPQPWPWCLGVSKVGQQFRETTASAFLPFHHHGLPASRRTLTFIYISFCPWFPQQCGYKHDDLFIFFFTKKQ